MKVLFLSIINKESNKGVGVLKKNIAQVKTLNNNGIQTYFGYYKNFNCYVFELNNKVIKEIELDNLEFIKKTQVIFDYATNFMLENKIEYLYSRWETFSIQASIFYYKLKRRNISVLLEIPTYPLNQRWISIKQEFYKGDFKQFIRRSLSTVRNSLGIPFMKFGVDKIVTNNDYDTIWNISTIKINNGVDISSINLKNINEEKNKNIKMIAVANIANWHGYDRIIKGMANYYSTKDYEYNVEFHIIGDGDEVPLLKKLVKALNLEKYILFYGLQTGDKLDNIFEDMSIAISVLGLHRCKMNNCDSLKSKEYCSRGIPFVTTHSEKEYEQFEYALKVSNDDNPVDMKDIISFALKYSNNLEVQKQIRKHAEQYYDWNSTFNNVITYIKGYKHAN